MAKRSNQKLRLLYINRILHELTDESSGITLAQLSSELSGYGIFAERKTLYDDIESLRVFGVDVRVKRDRSVRYYVANRELSFAELQLILDLVSDVQMLSATEKDSLRRTVAGLGGKKFLSELTEGLSELDAPSYEASVMKSAGDICNAMRQNKKFVCKQFDWNAKKQRIVRDGGKIFFLSPWYAYFLGGLKFIVYDASTSCLSVLSAERLLDVKIIDETRAGESEFLDALGSGRIRQMLLGASPQMLRFRASEDIMNDIIAYFGAGITVSAQDGNEFEFSARAIPSHKLFSWVFSFGGRLRIISPEPVTDSYRELLSAAYDSELSKYKK